MIFWLIKVVRSYRLIKSQMKNPQGGAQNIKKSHNGAFEASYKVVKKDDID